MMDFTDEKAITRLFALAGLPVIRKYRLENMYWPRPLPDDTDSCKLYYFELRESTPWWLVCTEYGEILIGPRKRVVELCWKHTRVRSIITEDNVTKDSTSVHAWSREDLIKYLSTLGMLLKAQPV